MNYDVIALVLDIVVLVFLGATIFYALRLSKSLNNFKASRREFDGVITSLLSSIDQAERSVQTLKQVSAQEAEELGNLIQQSKMMSEELKIINESGEGMARRLEALAEANRKIVQSSRPVSESVKKPQKISRPKPGARKVTSDPLPSFMVGDSDPVKDDGVLSQDLKSEAEQELFNALRGHKRNRSGGGRS